MKIERLRNGRYKLIFLCGFILVVVLLILSIVFKGSKAKYRNTQVIPFVKGYITAKKADFTTMGIYLEDNNGTEIKGTNARFYTNKVGEHILSGISKGDKCYIYLDRDGIKSFLLETWEIIEDDITIRTDFNTVRLDGGNKVYKANDESGKPSYYLVGNPTNNWVKFAEYYWRIVRINGDGSLRMIYQGTAANTTTGTNYTTSAYNNNYDNAAYVGYMFTTGVQRGFNISSTIKGAVDSFYSSKLSSYASYIDKNAGFCNDRSTVSGTGINGVFSTFAAFNRLYTNKAPVLTCLDSEDLFTASSSTKGNKKLAYPIGLITADEIAMGGLVHGIVPSTRYVNMYDTGQQYWTMSPTALNQNTVATVYNIDNSGKIYTGGNRCSVALGVRPVINLVKDITFSKGDGSSTSPFEI